MRSGFLNIGKASSALISIGAVILISGILLPFRQYVNATEVALLLLLLVLLSATLYGSRAGLAAAISGILSFNFFFLPPYYTFNISEPENWVAFGAFIITAIIAGQLSGYARRRAEESEARQKKIEGLYEELKAAVEQVSEAEAVRRSEKLKSALLDAVTHDLRTPLTSIKASVTTLLSDSKETDMDEGSKKEFLNIINEETDRLNDFIEGMVGIAKVEAGALDVRRATSSVEEIISHAVNRARIALENHVLETTVAPDIPPVILDGAAVSQVVFTLLDNAAKYSPAGSRIRLSARLTSGSKLRIMVEDEGEGIPSVERERVFDKFFRRGDPDVDGNTTGLGLGLTIARGMIESQGGRIWIEDGSGDFTTRVVCELAIDAREFEVKAAAK